MSIADTSTSKNSGLEGNAENRGDSRNKKIAELSRILLQITLLGFVLGGLVLLYLSFVWQAETIAYQNPPSIEFDKGQQLLVNYPLFVPVQDKPSEITFTLRHDHDLTQSLVITLTIPNELLLASPVDQVRKITQTVVVAFTPNPAPVLTHTVSVMNARLNWWPSIEPNSLGIETPKTNVKLPIQVESITRATLRNFVNSGTSVIVTALLSVAGLIVAQYQKQKEDEKKRSEDEAKKKRAEETLEAFRQQVRQQNMNGARIVLRTLETLIGHIPSIDIEHARQVVRLAEGNVFNTPIELLAQAWPNETAGALVFASLNNPAQKKDLRRAIRIVSHNRISNDLSEAIEKARKLVDAKPEQPRDWTIHPDKPANPLFGLPGFVGNRLKGKNPFPRERAEDEVDFLFSAELSAFWRDHLLYKRLHDARSAQVVWGMPGVGKTAMALALGEYPESDDVLSCYLAGLPNIRDIQFSFARKLVKFACLCPTWLGLLGRDERNLFARLCVGSLGRDLVLAEIDAVSPEEMDWLKNAGEDQERRHQWEEIANARLRLLKQAINDLDRSTISDDKWSLALVRCAHSLGFMQVRLVVDAPENGCLEWIRRSILPQLRRWTATELTIGIFLPQQVYEQYESSDNKFADELLTWNELNWQKTDSRDLLADMVRWRYEQTARQFNIRTPFEEVLPKDLLDKIIVSANFNPRCFARLWNQMASSSPDGMFTEALLRQVEKQIVCE